MAENKMEQVAAMFGKKVGEEFRVKDLKSGKIHVAYFDSREMKARKEGSSDSWRPRGDIVMRLILGLAVVVDD
jgi:hypothetical protein